MTFELVRVGGSRAPLNGHCSAKLHVQGAAPRSPRATGVLRYHGGVRVIGGWRFRMELCQIELLLRLRPPHPVALTFFLAAAATGNGSIRTACRAARASLHSPAVRRPVRTARPARRRPVAGAKQPIGRFAPLSGK